MSPTYSVFSAPIAGGYSPGEHCCNYGYDLRSDTTSNDISEMESNGTVLFATVPNTSFGSCEWKWSYQH